MSDYLSDNDLEVKTRLLFVPVKHFPTVIVFISGVDLSVVPSRRDKHLTKPNLKEKPCDKSLGAD